MTQVLCFWVSLTPSPKTFKILIYLKACPKIPYIGLKNHISRTSLLWIAQLPTTRHLFLRAASLLHRFGRNKLSKTLGHHIRPKTPKTYKEASQSPKTSQDLVSLIVEIWDQSLKPNHPYIKDRRDFCSSSGQITSFNCTTLSLVVTVNVQSHCIYKNLGQKVGMEYHHSTTRTTLWIFPVLSSTMLDYVERVNFG